MLEHSWLGDALRAGGMLIFLMYWGAALGLVYFVWNWFKKPMIAPGLLVIALAFGYLPFTIYQERKAREEYVTAAWAHFHKLCKEKAGVKVYKTVKGVESVLLTKPRPAVSADERELFDQFWRGDPYGGIAITDATGAIAFELLAPYGHSDSKTGVWRATKPPIFQYLESYKHDKNMQPKLVRYFRSKDDQIESDPIAAPSSAFELDWDDISTAEDQKYWVAASHWIVRDRKSGDVLGERVGFAIESGFGSRAGQRRAWLFATRSENTCPPIEQLNNQIFIRKIFE